jgi:hypothetical protein
MATSFVHSFQSEWMKKKRSAASWLMITGGIFVPLIVLISLLANSGLIGKVLSRGHFWEFIYNRSWPAMAMFLLPMGIILAVSLITQLEFKNNTWKQLHTTPQKLTTIFCAKLTVILSMMLQFFILFNIGMYLSAVIPALLCGYGYPQEAFPFLAFLKGNGKFFVDCLPIIALQYLISLQFRNFLVPVGVGLAIYVGSMIALNWKYCYIVPYTYCALNFKDNRDMMDPSAHTHVWALAYFVLFTALSYWLYIYKREKG